MPYRTAPWQTPSRILLTGTHTARWRGSGRIHPDTGISHFMGLQTWQTLGGLADGAPHNAPHLTSDLRT